MPIDYNKYPTNWKSKIVPLILDRDKHRCKFCGIENKQTVKSIKIRVQDQDGKYKLKAFWFSSESDLSRSLPLSNGDVKSVTVILTVAHLDHDETNHDVSMDRLAALCQFCHLNYDAKEKYRRAIQKG